MTVVSALILIFTTLSMSQKYSIESCSEDFGYIEDRTVGHLAAMLPREPRFPRIRAWLAPEAGKSVLGYKLQVCL